MNNYGNHLNSYVGLETHYFSEADLIISALTTGTVITVISDVRKDAMINLSSVLQKGFTLVQMSVARSSSSSQTSFISHKHSKLFYS